MQHLLAQKSIDQIRVTELCKEAEIERPTFYYHFQDKYDLMAWIFFQDAFQTDVLSVEAATDSMNRMKEHFFFYNRGFKDSSQNAMWKYLLEYLVEWYTEIAKQKLQTEDLDAQTLFGIRLYCYGTLGMTREWLLNDNNTSSGAIAEMMFAFMPDQLKTIYFSRQNRILIETKRLRIFTASQEEMQCLIDQQTNADLKAAYQEMLQGCLDHPEHWEWYAVWIIERKDNTHIGDLSFKGLKEDGSVEIGYGILEDYQNSGYATEAVAAAVDWALK